MSLGTPTGLVNRLYNHLVPNDAPHTHYDTQRAARRISEAAHATADRRLSGARLIVVGVTLALAWSAFWHNWISAWWLLVPAVVFAVLIQTHDRVIRRLETAERAVQWYERGLARLENRWAGERESGGRFLDDDHPYARDLDLFGAGSLFQLVNTCQTMTGEETLARWLLGAADPDTIRARQAAVADMSDRAQLREDLHTWGAEARQNVDSATLIAWAQAPPRLPIGWLRLAGPALAAGAVVSITAWSIGAVAGVVPLLMLLINGAVGLAVGRRAGQVLHRSSEPARELMVLARVLARLREESYHADELRRLHALLTSGAMEAPAAVRRLDWFIQMHDWQHNMMFAPIAAVLLWGVQCATAVETWRARFGASVPEWLSVTGQFEALAAFGTYRFENPADPFPELLEPTTPPVYEAEQLAHPLLPADEAVTNDMRLGSAPQLVVVSGSNMSGKTTLLRAVGVNGVLALAGAPVRARALRLSPAAIGGTLRVQDSLLAGRSKFYAEILRVKQLVEIAKGGDGLLFLMDELFHGTNSHDRVEGAHGVLDFLVGVGAVGMVTTHDLALSAIGDRLGSRARNVHFSDQVKAGELTFDYRLREGRATHGNALALMRAVGLDIAASDGRTAAEDEDAAPASG